MERTVLTRTPLVLLVLLLLGLLCPLSWPGSVQASDITVDGTGSTFGALPIISFGLAQGSDILPVGNDGFALFGLFDTGSTLVAINNQPGTGLFGNTDAFFLGISATQTVDVRINGLGATDPVTLLTPVGAPGEQGAAQVQVSGVAVAPRNVNVTLIGAPVANQVLALMDYTTTITRSFGGGITLQAPDITFFESSSAGLFTSEVELALERFGSTGTSNIDGATLGQRYLLRDVAFNDVGGTATGQSNNLLYDTGTDVTLLSAAMAQQLGLDLNAPEFTGLVGGSLLNGYTLDSILMTGLGGTYTITNAKIFVDQSAIPFGGAADAIIGSNLFGQTSLLFNGAGNSLGIGIQLAAAVPEPSALLLMAIGLAFLVYVHRKKGYA